MIFLGEKLECNISVGKKKVVVFFFFQGVFTLSNIVKTSVLGSCKAVLLSQQAM